MHDLQLVGLTTDRRGLIFRARAGARSDESFVIPVTDEVIELVSEVAAEKHGDIAGSATAEETGIPSEEAAPRRRSQLSVRDIQARLRAGEVTSRIAEEAGVEEEWIERFAPPVRAEQQRVVARALECHLQRSRSAPSGVPLRRAVGMALAEKGIAHTVAAYEAAWSARLLGHDRWAVTFTYRHRGRERVAAWSYAADDDVLTTTDRAAAQLGYVAPGRTGDDDDEAIDGVVGDPAAVAAGATRRPGEGPRPDPARSTRTTTSPAGPVKRSTAKKGTAGKKPVAEKPVAKKSPSTKKATARKRAAKVVDGAPAPRLPEELPRPAEVAVSAAPVGAAGASEPAHGERPAPEGDRPRPYRGETNGAARPATRRRRQLRAR